MVSRPHQIVVAYSRPIDRGHFGRNGTMQAHGIVVEPWGDAVHLVALVSDGRISRAARLAVPYDALPALISALTEAKSFSA